jgi:hypothetical protein
MNSPFVNSDDRIDVNIAFTKLKELFPKTKIKSVTVLREFTELAYKDHEMDVKFEFVSPHTVEMVYHGDEFVSIDDDEFEIYAGDTTEEGAVLDYICDLDFLWDRYATGKVTDISKGLRNQIETIKTKVKNYDKGSEKSKK